MSYAIPNYTPVVIKNHTGTTMTDYRAVALAEGFEEGTEAEQTEAWQHLHSTGLAYELQGWFGRTAQALLRQGVITLLAVTMAHAAPYGSAEQIMDDFHQRQFEQEVENNYRQLQEEINHERRRAEYEREVLRWQHQRHDDFYQW